MSAPVAKVLGPATIVDVGTPPLRRAYKFSRNATWETVEVHFHGFKDLPSERSEPVPSTQFTCIGCQWNLAIYPGGDDESSDGYVGLDLLQCSGPPIEVMVVLNAKNSSGKQIAHCRESSGLERFNYEDQDVGGVSVRADCPDFAKRSKVLNSLVGGTLIVEVIMTPDGGAAARQPFIPENPLCKNILERFNEEENSDVVFEVGRESPRGADDASEGGAKKKSRGEAVQFYAHQVVLQDSATTLSELAKSAQSTSPIQINDVKPEIFRHLLHYVYGGTVPGGEIEEHAKDIIDAADKYGVVGLKLQAEAHYARSLALTVDNVLDNLLYADSKNCAYLKEVVVDFIVENGKSILGNVSFENVPGATVTDILTAVARGGKTGVARYDTMRVGTLRRKLHEKGLDIDGSREAMIALLKEHS